VEGFFSSGTNAKGDKMVIDRDDRRRTESHVEFMKTLDVPHDRVRAYLLLARGIVMQLSDDQPLAPMASVVVQVATMLQRESHWGTIQNGGTAAAGPRMI
jgi:hypothetical protein